MAQTRTSCPRCRQPVMVEMNQLFDMNQDPEAKEKLLSGQFNFIHCTSCGYEGSFATPVVYHDPEKELLLTFFPPEMGLPLNEQEKLMGPLISQVTNKLPMEKRKAYLLRPQSMLTYQTLFEKILEADGITKEMIQAQQNRLNLLQRLVTANESARDEIIRQEDSLIDESFFSIMNRLAEASLAGGDQNTAKALSDLQKKILSVSTFGRKLQEQAHEAETAMKDLQEISKQGLTREALLDLILAAPNETRLSAIVGLTRSALDYQFFQLLTEKLEASQGDERARIEKLRSGLLDMTKQIDDEIQARVARTRQLLEAIVKAPDVKEATQKSLQAITNVFVDILEAEIEEARKKADLERLGKLSQIMEIIKEASTPPPEFELVEKLLAAPGDAEVKSLLEANAEKVTPEFLDFLDGLIAQAEEHGDNPDVVNKLKAIDRTALRFSMAQNLSRG